MHMYLKKIIFIRLKLKDIKKLIYRAFPIHAAYLNRKKKLIIKFNQIEFLLPKRVHRSVCIKIRPKF